MDVHAPPGILSNLQTPLSRGGEIEKRPAFIGCVTFRLVRLAWCRAAVLFTRLARLLRIRSRFRPLRQTTLCISSLFTRPGKTWLRFFLTMSFLTINCMWLKFADGRVYHYYDGTRILDWFPGQARTKLTITGGSAGGQNARMGWVVQGTNSDFIANQSTISISMTSPSGVSAVLLNEGVWNGNNEASILDWVTQINGNQTELTASRGSRVVNGVTPNDVLLLDWNQPGEIYNGYTFQYAATDAGAGGVYAMLDFFLKINSRAFQ